MQRTKNKQNNTEKEQSCRTNTTRFQSLSLINSKQKQSKKNPKETVNSLVLNIYNDLHEMPMSFPLQLPLLFAPSTLITLI